MTAVVVLGTCSIVVGLVVALSPGASATDRALGTPVTPRSVVPSLAGLAAGVVLLAASGWVAPSAVVGVAVARAVSWRSSTDRTAASEITRLDALAGWIESVRDVLVAGEQPIGAIQATVAACPPPLRPAVRRLASGLGRQDPDLVFRRFADDLDDPVGDLVATGLSIAIRRGARTVPVLTALAEQTRQQVDRRRLVEAERAPARREVQALTLIMSGLVLALLVFGRVEYLDAYDDPAGQVVLTCALAGYAGLLIRVRRLAAFPRPSRFLTGVEVTA
ncbi:MAG: type II secretion system F family protein [Ilumatobacteraceae bacterium]